MLRLTTKCYGVARACSCETVELQAPTYTPPHQLNSVPRYQVLRLQGQGDCYVSIYVSTVESVTYQGYLW